MVLRDDGLVFLPLVMAEDHGPLPGLERPKSQAGRCAPAPGQEGRQSLVVLLGRESFAQECEPRAVRARPLSPGMEQLAKPRP